MKVIVSVEVLNDDGGVFSATTNANDGLDKAAAVALRERLTDGLTAIYKALSKEVEGQ